MKTLSDKRNAPRENSVTQYTPYYYEEDVKEFIKDVRQLLEDTVCCGIDEELVMATFDELAGEKLT